MPIAPLPRCEDVPDLVSDLIDGELAPEDAERLELHLAACPACLRVAWELFATVEALHALPRPDACALPR